MGLDMDSALHSMGDDRPPGAELGCAELGIAKTGVLDTDVDAAERMEFVNAELGV